MLPYYLVIWQVFIECLMFLALFLVFNEEGTLPPWGGQSTGETSSKQNSLR